MESLVVRWVVISSVFESDRGPGQFEADLSCDNLTSLMDILPRLVEATGIEYDDFRTDGRSLDGLLTDQAPQTWRDYLLIMHHGNMYGLCTMRAVVGSRSKYVHYPYDKPELYDLRSDQWKMSNLIDDPDYQSVALSLREQLQNLMREAGDDKVRIF